jgi:hypothetical protein
MVFLEKSFSRLTSSSTRGVVGDYSGAVNLNKRKSDHRFTLTQRSKISVALTGLRADADLLLRSSGGRVIARSRKPGSKSEFIRRTLEPGTYSLRVVRYSGGTNYRLVVSDEANSTSLPTAPAPSPTTPTPLPTAPPVTPANPLQSLWGKYRGVGNTTIGTYDPLSGQLIGANSFKTNIAGTIASPKSAGGLIEDNPFNLSISSPAAAITQSGEFSMFSALPFNFQGGYLLQYWKLQYEGNQIIGKLVNTGVAESLAINSFNATQNFGSFSTPFPYTMGTDTILQGTITSNEIRVRIQGFDTGKTRFFSSEVIAQRV